MSLTIYLPLLNERRTTVKISVHKALRWGLISSVCIGAILLIACIAALLYANTSHAQKLLLAQVNKRIPGRLEWAHLRIGYFSGTVTIADLILADAADSAIAGFDSLRLNIDIPQLFAQHLNITQFHLVRPFTRLELDSCGQINIVSAFVATHTTGSMQNDSIESENTFDVTLQKLTLDEALFGFSAARSAFSISASGIQFTAGGQLSPRYLTAHLSLDSAHIGLPETSLVVSQFSAQAEMNGDTLRAVRLTATTGKSSIDVHGSAQSILSPTPVVEVTLSSKTSLSDLDFLLDLPERYTGHAGIELTAQGPADNPDAQLKMHYSGGFINGIGVDAGNLELAVHDRVVDTLHLDLKNGGGSFSLAATASLTGMFPEGFLGTANLDSLAYDLTLVQDEFNSAILPWVAPHVKGFISGRQRISGIGIIPERMRADLSLALKSGSPDITYLQERADIAIEADARMDQGIAAWNRLACDIDDLALTGRGTLDLSSMNIAADFRIDSIILHRLLPLAGIKSIHGAGQVDLRVDGTPAFPDILLQVRADSLTYRNYSIGSLFIEAAKDAHTVTCKAFELRNSASRLALRGSAELFQKGSFKLRNRPQIDVNHFQVGAAIQDFVDNLSGTVKIAGSCTGALPIPRGSFSIRAADVDAGVQRIGTFAADLLLDSSRIYLQHGSVETDSANKLVLSGWVSPEKAYDISLKCNSFDITAIDRIEALDLLQGYVQLSLRSWGTFDNPNARGDMRISEVAISNRPLDDLSLSVNLADHFVHVRGDLGFHAQTSYDLKRSDFDAHLTFDSTILAPYFALTSQSSLDGFINGSVTARGTANDVKAVQAEMLLDDVQIVRDSLVLVEGESLRAHLTGDSVSIPGLHLNLLRSGSLHIAGYARLNGALSLNADGAIPADLLGSFSPDFADARGTVRLKATASGTQQSPELNAQVHLEDIALTVPQLYQRVTSLDGTIRIDRDSIHIDSISGNIERGVFTCAGKIELEDFQPGRFGLNVTTSLLPVSIPDLLDVTLNTDLHLNGSDTLSFLQGNIELVNGLYYKEVDIITLEGLTRKKREQKPPTQSEPIPYLSNMQIDIAVSNRRLFEVNNNLAQLSIKPDLQIEGTPEKPIVLGRAEVAEGFIEYSKRMFEVKKGVIDFDNPYKIEPRIDIIAQATIDSVTITLTVSGTPEALDFKLESDDKSLEHADLLMIIVLGKRPETMFGKQGGQTSPTQLLAQLVNTRSEDLKSATGLDLIEVGSNTNGRNEDGLSVTLGKNISRRLATRITLEQDASEISQKAIIEYKLLEQLLLQSMNDSRGNYGGELKFKIEFR
ncbi:MAG: hypothetical protein GF398_13750 [Chitinivibrionales bacterium]|nr:hypothetical protein [Chitinivibrionales bacterium]